MRRLAALALGVIVMTALTPAAASSVPPPVGLSSRTLQAITVHAASRTSTYATLTAWRRSTASGPWVRAAQPWTARVGRNGIAAPGAKREGDGKTPSGTYGFGFAFGVAARPATQVVWRQVTGSWHVWDDDASSQRYNLWTDTRTAHAGRSPEPLYIRGTYDAALVIAYNTARTPGLGSGIFLHVSSGQATSGCISLASDRVRGLISWLSPVRYPVIVISAG